MTEGDYMAEFANGDQRSFEYLLNPLHVGEETRSIAGSPRESTERKRRERERERARERFSSFEAEPPASSRERPEVSLTIRTGLRPVRRERRASAPGGSTSE